MSTSDYIDALLEQYLTLLDQYTSLRNELNNLQTSVYHYISRANFNAERGIRYGQGFYDARMQASTTLEITLSSADDLYKFSVANNKQKQNTEPISRNEEDAQVNETLQQGIEKLNLELPENETPTRAGEEEGKDSKPSQTPLSWFGILAPGAQSLRSAQAASASMISTIIPKIASIDWEMKELEIRIRRARKFRSKAETEIAKERIHARNADVEATLVSEQ